MKEVCDVGLPHEIIENILSRLPVKDLLRFRVVCKQWKATISDPTFSEIHLQRCKNSSSQNLFAWVIHLEYNGLYVGELRNNCIEIVSTIECVLDRVSSTMCSCDGLYLKRVIRGKRGYVLWNPSSRMYRELCCPPSVIVCGGDRSINAMYYDPLTKDYKILFADMEHYAVYSCRDNKWGDVKEMKGFLGEFCFNSSVFVNGCFYWIVLDASDPKDDESNLKFREIICFDCKDESFRILAWPNGRDCDDKYFQLTSFGGQLCLFVGENDSYRVKIMKKDTSVDEWMECKAECLWECRSNFYPEPLCEISENELLLSFRRGGKTVYMVYDKSKNRAREIKINHPLSEIASLSPIPHVENILLL